MAPPRAPTSEGEGGGDITQWLAEMLAGDAEAVESLWNACFPRLTGYARRLLGRFRSRFADEEDAALSAFATFWRRYRGGEFPWVTDRETLWKLLATVTARKVRRQCERERTGRRGGGNVVHASALPAHSLTDEAAVKTADADSVGSDLLERLDDPELQTIALMRLMGYENGEIAREVGLSLRTVERKLRLVRTIWVESLEE